MPELPEVETITQDLKKVLVGHKITDVWSDWPIYFKKSGGLEKCRRILVGRKITEIDRLGKNIVFYLSDKYIMAVHLKMTGHFLTTDPVRLNQVHFILTLRSDLRGRSDLGIKKLYFSDVRKFARLIIGTENEVMARPEINLLGPDPLKLSTQEFLNQIPKRKGRIKTVLMNQEFLAGVGNIYSDEALYMSKIHPMSRAEKIPQEKLKELFINLVAVLKKSLKLRGTTRQDYRDVAGKKGGYFANRLVYARKGEECLCEGIIGTVTIGSRTSHFCASCQKLYT